MTRARDRLNAARVALHRERVEQHSTFTEPVGEMGALWGPSAGVGLELAVDSVADAASEACNAHQ